ncbi:MAG: DUF5723 family protein, partial [Ignavibacteria bacterium]
MKNHKYIFFLSFLVLYILVAMRNQSIADDRSNARGMGMSNASMVSSFGINAYGINPANYYHNKFKVDAPDIKLSSKKSKKDNFKPQWDISLMSVGGGYGSDNSLDFYNNYLKYLTVNRETFSNLFTDINSVLNFRQNILPDEKTDVNYDFELKWLSVNYTNPKFGAVNFTISDKVGLNTDVLSRDDYLPLKFLIIPHSGGSYDLVNVELNQSEAIAWWIRKYTVGFAKEFELKGAIKSLSIGFSAGLVHGFGNVIVYNSSILLNTYGISDTTNGTHIDSIRGKQNFYSQAALTDFFTDYKDGARSHFTFFPKPAGKGYTFDFGISMQIGEKLRVAASITEVGKITWDYNTNINSDTNSFFYRDFVLNSSDPTYNAFVNDLDGLDTRLEDVPYDTYMPTKYRAGIMYQPGDKFLLEFNWLKG